MIGKYTEMKMPTFKALSIIFNVVVGILCWYVAWCDTTLFSHYFWVAMVGSLINLGYATIHYGMWKYYLYELSLRK
jgi:hypothetical protein